MILEHLHSNVPGWDWIELGISPQQAWLEPDIVAPEHGSSVMHFYSDASVEVPLPGTIAELDGQLKRNVTESIRRARNRLARDGREWSVTELTDGPDLDAAFGDLRRLHRARAHMDVRSRHPDRMATPQREAFVREAVSGLAVVGAASIFLMRVDARAAAVVLSLRAHESTFVSISGYDPALWDYGVMTLLTQEVLHSGVARGHSVVDLSLGPDNAKLRWSEHVAIHPYFAVVRRGPRARLAFRAFLHARAQLPKVLANQPPGAYAGPHARGIAGGEAAGAPEHE
jgi:CelD/BcsL family acetyltransferase involved in cellulose biosynthesis